MTMTQDLQKFRFMSRHVMAIYFVRSLTQDAPQTHSLEAKSTRKRRVVSLEKREKEKILRREKGKKGRK